MEVVPYAVINNRSLYPGLLVLEDGVQQMVGVICSLAVLQVGEIEK